MNFIDILLIAIFGAAFALGLVYVILEIRTLIDILKSPVIKFSTFKQSYETKNDALKWSTYSRHPENWSLYKNYVSIDFTHFRFSFKDTLKYRKWRKEQLKNEKEKKISEILLDIYEQIKLDEKRKAAEESVRTGIYEITSDDFCNTKTTYSKECFYAEVYSDHIYYSEDYYSEPINVFPESTETLLRDINRNDKAIVYLRNDECKTDFEIYFVNAPCYDQLKEKQHE